MNWYNSEEKSRRIAYVAKDIEALRVKTFWDSLQILPTSIETPAGEVLGREYAPLVPYKHTVRPPNVTNLSDYGIEEVVEFRRPTYHTFTIAMRVELFGPLHLWSVAEMTHSCDIYLKTRVRVIDRPQVKYTKLPCLGLLASATGWPNPGGNYIFYLYHALESTQCYAYLRKGYRADYDLTLADEANTGYNFLVFDLLSRYSEINPKRIYMRDSGGTYPFYVKQGQHISVYQDTSYTMPDLLYASAAEGRNNAQYFWSSYNADFRQGASFNYTVEITIRE